MYAGTTSKSLAAQNGRGNDSQVEGIKISGNPYGVAVNPTKNMIYVVDKFYKKVSFLDGDTDRVVKTIVIPNNPTSDRYQVNVESAIAVSPFLNLLFIINSASQTMNALDAPEGNMVTNFTLDGSPRALIADDVGGFIYVLSNIIHSEKSGNLTETNKISRLQ